MLKFNNKSVIVGSAHAERCNRKAAIIYLSRVFDNQEFRKSGAFGFRLDGSVERKCKIVGGDFCVKILPFIADGGGVDSSYNAPFTVIAQVKCVGEAVGRYLPDFRNAWCDFAVFIKAYKTLKSVVYACARILALSELRVESGGGRRQGI